MSRCSDGWYTSFTVENGIIIYSDQKALKLETATKIEEFIRKHLYTYDDRLWHNVSDDTYEEKIDSKISEALVQLLDNKQVVVTENPNATPVNLNDVVNTTVSIHHAVLSEFKKGQQSIKRKYQVELENNKIKTASAALKANVDIYDLNNKIQDFNEFPLDIAMKSNNVELFENLYNKNARKVSHRSEFVKWLCKINRFEYINDYYDINELQFNDYDTSFPPTFKMEFYGVAQCIIYYTLYHSRIDLYEKYCKGNYLERIGFDPIQNAVSANKILVAKYVLQNSPNSIVLHLLDINFNFFIEVIDHPGSYHYSLSLGWSKKKVLLNELFLREELLSDIYKKFDSKDVIYSLFYWKEYDLLSSYLEKYKSKLDDITLYQIGLFEKFPEAIQYIEKICSLVKK